MSSVAASQHATLSFETPASLKQKRKRTSPRDHAVLETAYQKNSKPGKEERAELVQQVELSEKEVQIWFQNRRQNDRRKSKPLLPHELIPHFRNGIPSEVSHQLVSPVGSQESLHAHPVDNDVANLPIQPTRPPSRASSIKNLLNPTLDSEPKKHSMSFNTSQLTTPPPSCEDKASNSSESGVAGSKSGFANDNGAAVVAKKRSHEEMSRDGNSLTHVIPSSETIGEEPVLKRSSSFVRLAVNPDGSFKVRTNNELTPSPPKKRVPPQNSPSQEKGDLVRSRSATGTEFNFKDINPPIRQVPGRSRDARTWEFYCDRQARDSLAIQAEEQENGSAISAINLMRAGNQTKPVALSPNPSKHNRRRIGGAGGSKPVISRSRSSLARMQSTGRQNESSIIKPKPHARKNSGSDSDKENWMPGTRDSHNTMRRMHPSAPRSTVLQEHGSSIVQQFSDPETEERCNNIRMSSDKAKVDDLDCIQGLLSLSQGAWK